MECWFARQLDVRAPADVRVHSWRGHRRAREGLVLVSEGPLGQQRTFVTTHGEVSAEPEKVVLGSEGSLGHQRTFLTNQDEVSAELEKVLS